MRFNTSVELAVDNEASGWTLTIINRTDIDAPESFIKTSKLVVATGLTSEPFMPSMCGRDDFDAPIYHPSEFAKAEDGPGMFKKVVLLSGAKSSWDFACAYASAGIQVDWVIRESGHGPCWMTSPRLTPFKIIPELLLQTRLITWLSPCIWEDGFSNIRNFFSKKLAWSLDRRQIFRKNATQHRRKQQVSRASRNSETASMGRRLLHRDQSGAFEL